jgi:hypothetical protein
MPDGPSTSRKERRGRQAARATNFKFQKRPMKRTKLNQIKVNKGPGGLPSAQAIRHGQMGRAFSPRFWLGTFPGALPQAGMVRAFGPCPWDEQAQQPPNHIISHQFPAFLDQKKLRCLRTAIRPTLRHCGRIDFNRFKPISTYFLKKYFMPRMSTATSARIPDATARRETAGLHELFASFSKTSPFSFGGRALK